MMNSFGTFGMPEAIVILATALIGGVLVMWPVSRILRRLGFPAWLAPFAVVPLLNLALLWFVAFTEPSGHRSARERS